MAPHFHTIRLHREAPEKPAVGQPCNGCGVCCALETCPLARLRFWQRHGPCPALLWQAEAVSDATTGGDNRHLPHENRYGCGLLCFPARYWPFLPRWSLPFWRRLTRRWIAAGQGCDAGYEVAEDKTT